MGFINPSPPHYDVAETAAAPYHERMRRSSIDWVDQGFGAPISAYLFYLIKIGLWIWGWTYFVGQSVEGGITEWWDLPVAFAKGILWTMLYEGLGLGCGSGPLTVRNLPPVAAFLHFLRPGTIRLAPFPRHVPLTDGTTRTWLDVVLYAAHVGLVLRALLSAELTPEVVIPTVVLLPLMGLRDKTIFLSARAEHYWTTAVVLAVVSVTTSIGGTTAWDEVVIVLAGAKAVQLAIWWWAATSKLNNHFPYVVSIMVSNHVLNRSMWLRKKLVRSYPEDLRPSHIPALLAHGGTVIEYTIPLLLLLSDGGIGTTIGLIVIISFHTFIFSAFALGVPQEWNLFFIYSAVVLWGGDNAMTKPWEIGANPVIWVTLLTMLVLLPLLGNLFPRREISFLTSMRYYAGNWGTSTWLLKPSAIQKIEDHVTKAAPDVMQQMAKLVPEEALPVTVNRVATFRAMHLHGRLMQRLIGRAVEDPDEYQARDGEILTGVVMGWNFGEYQLHNDQLMDALDERCGFEPGEVRIVRIHPTAIHRPVWDWEIVDAADGVLLTGEATTAEATTQQPWPEPLQGATGARREGETPVSSG